MVIVILVIVLPVDRLPGVPRDLEDHGGDHQADDRIGEAEAECDDGRACDYAEADEAVDARMVSVGDESRAVQPAPCSEPNLGCDLVADEADQAGGREEPEV